MSVAVLIFIPTEVEERFKLDGFVQSFIFKDQNSQDKSVPKATRDLMTNGSVSLEKKEVFVSGVKIFYGSQTGTAKVRTFYNTFLWVSWSFKKIPEKCPLAVNWIGLAVFFYLLFFSIHFSFLGWWVGFNSCAQFQLVGGIW